MSTRPLVPLLVALGAVAAFVAAAAVTAASVVVDDVRVSSRSELASVGFGWPVAWVHQDHTTMVSRLPADVGFLSPWEYPTDVSRAVFLLDTLVVFAMVCALGLAIVGVTYLVRRPPPSRTGG